MDKPNVFQSLFNKIWENPNIVGFGIQVWLTKNLHSYQTKSEFFSGRIWARTNNPKAYPEKFLESIGFIIRKKGIGSYDGPWEKFYDAQYQLELNAGFGHISRKYVFPRPNGYSFKIELNLETAQEIALAYKAEMLKRQMFPEQHTERSLAVYEAWTKPSVLKQDGLVIEEYKNLLNTGAIKDVYQRYDD